MAKGTHVMVAGLAFQTATMACFTLLALIFAVRLITHHQSPPPQTPPAANQPPQNQGLPRLSKGAIAFFCSLGTSTLLILGRSGYRIAELSGGWTGARMANQTHFIIFEGFSIFTASLLLVFCHPDLCAREVLRNRRQDPPDDQGEPGASGASGNAGGASQSADPGAENPGAENPEAEKTTAGQIPSGQTT